MALFLTFLAMVVTIPHLHMLRSKTRVMLLVVTTPKKLTCEKQQMPVRKKHRVSPKA